MDEGDTEDVVLEFEALLVDVGIKVPLLSVSLGPYVRKACVRSSFEQPLEHGSRLQQPMNDRGSKSGHMYQELP